MKKAAIILCMICFVVAGIAFFFLPQEIPMHYNASGVIDRYGNRMEIFLIPFVTMALTAILILFKKIDPKNQNIVRFKKTYDQFLFIINLCMLIILLMMIMGALFPESLNINLILWIVLSCLFTIFGNLMPKCKQNYFMGIRTPWTLANEQVWFKTHRFAGKVWFYGGLLMLLAVVIPFSKSMHWLLAATIVLGLIPCVYSYLCFKKIENSEVE